MEQKPPNEIKEDEKGENEESDDYEEEEKKGSEQIDSSQGISAE